MIEKVKYIVNLVIVVLLLVTVAIQRDGKVFGVDVITMFQRGNDQENVDIPIETTLSDGTKVINTTILGKDIIGFGGRTPVKLYVKGDVIQKVEVEPNSETPSFFDEVVKSGLLEKWNGKTLAEALSLNIDAVSGSTYSSEAVIGNVKSAIAYATDVKLENDNFFSSLSLKDIVGVLVILLGVFFTFRKTKNKSLLTLQLALNVVVLGFWCGSFLSFATFTTWIGNGVNFSLSLVTFAMLCVAVLLPLFDKKGTYCQMHCPMGSAQQLLGQIPFTKIKIAPKIAKFLNNLRYYILVMLLFVMWLGVGFDLMDYEVFSAFIFSSASMIVLIMAVVFLILSLFIHRPYCRFVCPTGALITITQKTK